MEAAKAEAPKKKGNDTDNRQTAGYAASFWNHVRMLSYSKCCYLYIVVLRAFIRLAGHNYQPICRIRSRMSALY
jgi:hypothetical protein